MYISLLTCLLSVFCFLPYNFIFVAMKTSIFLSSRSHMITHRAARNNSSIQFVRYLLYLVCTFCVTSFLVCLMSFNVYTIHLNVICRSQICDGLIQCTIIITVSCFVSQFWQLYKWWCWCVYTRCDGHILSSSSMLCVRSLAFFPIPSGILLNSSKFKTCVYVSAQIVRIYRFLFYDSCAISWLNQHPFT